MARQVREPALRAYLTSLRGYPLLEPQEEHALALRYVGSRSPALATELVTRNLRLVVKIAFEYRRTPLGMLDLIQEGNLGLVRAVEKYDPNRGAKLASYAAWWIRAYILRFIQEHWHLVKIRSTNANRRLFFGLRRELAKLQQEGHEADSGTTRSSWPSWRGDSGSAANECARFRDSS